MDNSKTGGIYADPVETYDVRVMVDDDLWIVDVETERPHTLAGPGVPSRCGWRVYVSWWDGLRACPVLTRAPDGYVPTQRERRAAARHAEMSALSDRIGRQVTKRDLAQQRRPSDDADAPPWLAYLLRLDRGE